MGKTAAAIAVAERLHCHIINADSRQVYRDIPVCTAAPTADEQARVPHHFVGCLALDEEYNAARFEADVMALLPSLWQQGPDVVMCGGSMLYVDAVCRGIDTMPDADPILRSALKQQCRREGLQPLLDELQRNDPDYYAVVDRHNPVRVIHAIEMIRLTGQPFSSLRTGQAKPRPFDIVKIALNVPRDTLFDRINARVHAMMAAGLEDEVRRVAHLRHLKSLNTVGVKEMLALIDGIMTREQAVARLQKNTRVYAKKQLTWLRRDPTLTWCEPDQLTDVLTQVGVFR